MKERQNREPAQRAGQQQNPSNPKKGAQNPQNPNQQRREGSEAEFKNQPARGPHELREHGHNPQERENPRRK